MVLVVCVFLCMDITFNRGLPCLAWEIDVYFVVLCYCGEYIVGDCGGGSVCWVGWENDCCDSLHAIAVIV